ncbi:Thrombospondin type-1 domain-containing protein 7A, partial [Xenoophorus captivus]
AGTCMCEEGFTEVLSPAGQLDQCAPIPVLEIPTAGDKKGDVKTSRAINPTLPSTIQPGRTGRTWYLQPYGPGQSSTDTVHSKLTFFCTKSLYWIGFVALN